MFFLCLSSFPVATLSCPLISFDDDDIKITGKEASEEGRERIHRGANIRRDLSPTTQEIIQEERIYLLITGESENTDLSVNSDAPIEIGENMPENSGNKKTTEAQNNHTVQEENVLTTNARNSVANRSDGIRNDQCGN